MPSMWESLSISCITLGIPMLPASETTMQCHFEERTILESVAHCDHVKPKNLRARSLHSNVAAWNIYTRKSHGKLDWN